MFRSAIAIVGVRGETRYLTGRGEHGWATGPRNRALLFSSEGAAHAEIDQLPFGAVVIPLSDAGRAP